MNEPVLARRTQPRPSPITPSAIARAAEVTALLEPRCAAWPALFRTDALPGLALAVTTSAPTLPLRDLVTLTGLGVWLCAFDDLVDDPDTSTSDVELRIAHYETLITQGRCAELAYDPVAELLGEVLTELRDSPLARAGAWPLFTTQFLAGLDAMRWERRVMAGEHVPPSLELYLDRAAESVFASVVITATALLAGERPVLRQVTTLLWAERSASTVIRIANDVATWAREQHEHSANAFRFAGPDAAAKLTRRMRTEQMMLDVTLPRLAGCPVTASFIERLTEFFVATYAVGDLEVHISK